MAGISGAAPLRVLLLGTKGDPATGNAGIITGVTTGISRPIDVSPYQNLTFYVIASAALSSGTLILEEADWDPDTQVQYGGTYSQIASITLSSPFSGAGGQYAYHVGGPGGSYSFGFVRARLSADAVGGTVIVVVRAN